LLYGSYNVKETLETRVVGAIVDDFREYVHAKVLDECSLPGDVWVHHGWYECGVENLRRTHETNGTVGLFQHDVAHLLKHFRGSLDHSVQELFERDVLFQRGEFDPIATRGGVVVIYKGFVPIFIMDIFGVFYFHVVAPIFNIRDEFRRL
jgi:hypothetical protein